MNLYTLTDTTTGKNVGGGFDSKPAARTARDLMNAHGHKTVVSRGADHRRGPSKLSGAPTLPSKPARQASTA